MDSVDNYANFITAVLSTAIYSACISKGFFRDRDLMAGLPIESPNVGSNDWIFSRAQRINFRKTEGIADF